MIYWETKVNLKKFILATYSYVISFSRALNFRKEVTFGDIFWKGIRPPLGEFICIWAVSISPWDIILNRNAEICMKESGKVIYYILLLKFLFQLCVSQLVGSSLYIAFLASGIVIPGALIVHLRPNGTLFMLLTVHLSAMSAPPVLVLTQVL